MCLASRFFCPKSKINAIFVEKYKNMKTTQLLLISLLWIFTSACNKEDDTPPMEEPKPVVITSDWFSVSYLNPNTYIIEEPKSSQGNVSYLLIGEEKALMFDTGTGENEAENGFKIKHIIDQLTDEPVSLLLSHFHFDHNQNIAEFDRLAFADLPFLRQKVDANDHYTFTIEDLFWGDYPAQVKVDEWLPVNADIDLGNRTIQLVNIQGHASESVAIVDKTNKLAFLGDYLYNGALFVFDEADLPLYEESIDHLIAILDAEYRLFGAHGTPEISFGKLQRLKEFLVCIQNEACSSIPEIVFGEPVLYYEFQGMQMVIFQ